MFANQKLHVLCKGGCGYLQIQEIVEFKAQNFLNLVFSSLLHHSSFLLSFIFQFLSQPN